MTRRQGAVAGRGWGSVNVVEQLAGGQLTEFLEAHITLVSGGRVVAVNTSQLS